MVGVSDVIGALGQTAELGLNALGLALAVFGIGQSAHHHRHELMWSEIDYYLQIRQVHYETLDNMREDLRDMYEMDSRRIDNGMIVTTLMLSLGFGFVVEGTFPPTEPASDSHRLWMYQAQHVMRVIYAAVAGLALICPFFSLLALMECRRRLDIFMDQFNDKFYDMLCERFYAFLVETQSIQDIQGSHCVQYTRHLPHDRNDFLRRLYSMPSTIRDTIRGPSSTPRSGQARRGSLRDLSRRISSQSCCRRIYRPPTVETAGSSYLQADEPAACGLDVPRTSSMISSGSLRSMPHPSRSMSSIGSHSERSQRTSSSSSIQADEPVMNAQPFLNVDEESYPHSAAQVMRRSGSLTSLDGFPCQASKRMQEKTSSARDRELKVAERILKANHEGTEVGSTPGDFALILALHSDYAQWWYHWCKNIESISQTCHWLGVVFNVLCCAVLLGMSFQFNYPDTPAMWKIYSCLVTLCLIISLVFALAVQCNGPKLEPRLRHVPVRAAGERRLPEWMKEEFSNPLLPSSNSLPRVLRTMGSRS